MKGEIMIKIFDIKNYEELICPEHYINLLYRIENNELVLKCEFCGYTLVQLTEDRKKQLGF